MNNDMNNMMIMMATSVSKVCCVVSIESYREGNSNNWRLTLEIKRSLPVAVADANCSAATVVGMSLRL